MNLIKSKKTKSLMKEMIVIIAKPLLNRDLYLLAAPKNLKHLQMLIFQVRKLLLMMHALIFNNREQIGLYLSR